MSFGDSATPKWTSRDPLTIMRPKMALTVVVRSGESDPPLTITFDAPRIVIGRGDGCDVCLPDATVSHRHASLRQRGSEYIILDEGSTNGSFVGSVRIPAHTARIVRSGDLLRVGRVWLELRLEPGVPTAQPHLATKELALSLVANALRAEGQPAALRVLVQSGVDAGRSVEIVDFDQPHVIGRAIGTALTLEDPDASRRHLEVTRRGAQLFVRDLGTRNGTYFGETRLQPDQEYGWKPGVCLRIGDDYLVYEDQVTETLSELERAADERMRDDEAISPPSVEAASETRKNLSVTTPGASSPRSQKPRVPVPARVPSGRPTPYHPPNPGWNATDYLIAFLAMVVVALSGVGMVWLFRMG